MCGKTKEPREICSCAPVVVLVIPLSCNPLLYYLRYIGWLDILQTRGQFIQANPEQCMTTKLLDVYYLEFSITDPMIHVSYISLHWNKDELCIPRISIHHRFWCLRLQVNNGLLEHLSGNDKYLWNRITIEHCIHQAYIIVLLTSAATQNSISPSSNMAAERYITAQEQTDIYAKYRPTYRDTSIGEEIVKYLNLDEKQVKWTNYLQCMFLTSRRNLVYYWLSSQGTPRDSTH